MNSPLVSVVMPVYNAEKYVGKAIESILNQSFTDFELIVVNDGSKDNSLKIIKSYDDKRIRTISHSNIGVSTSRNIAAAKSLGVYIAMHDADDISLPERFKKQVSYLEKHQDVGLVGTSLDVIDENGKHQSYINLLSHPHDLKLAEIFSNQIAQGSVMIRNEVFQKSGGYNPQVSLSEDTDLWRRVSRISKIANLKDYLYQYRVHRDNAMHNTEGIRKSALETRDREFEYYLEHKSEYKSISFHPFSMRGGLLSYLDRKSSVYRDMSLMYGYKGLWRWAIPIVLLAILHAPWIKKSYTQLQVMLVRRNSIYDIDYELF